MNGDSGKTNNGRLKPYGNHGAHGNHLMTREKGRGKQGMIRGETTASLDDTLVTETWKNHRTIPSPDPKQRRRNRSTEPESDKQGNMYYKIDPA